MKKFISILIIMVMIFACFSSFVYADEEEQTQEEVQETLQEASQEAPQEEKKEEETEPEILEFV